MRDLRTSKSGVLPPSWIPGSEKSAVEKGNILLRQGDEAKHAYFVVSGCLMSYVTVQSGKDHVLQFAPEGWFASDINSLFNGGPAAVSIEAIEASEVIFLNRAIPQNMEDIPSEIMLEQVKLLRNNIIAVNRRVIQLLSSTAEERYMDFISTYPGLAQRIPLKLIAAYLGITPEFLSRIRKGRAGK